MNKRDKIIGIIAATAVVAACAFLVAGNMSNSSDVVVRVDSFTSTTEISSEETESETVKTEKTTKKSSSSSNKTSSSKSGSDSEVEVYIEFPLNLNTVTAEELTYIDGIGEVTAAKIIEYREVQGSYKNRNELLNIDGIGEKTLANIWDYLYIENEDFGETEDSSENEDTDDDSIDENIEIETSESETEVIKIDLNSATFEDLMQIPEYDEEICEAILELRDKIDYFSDVLELLYADGMTKNLFSQTEKYFYVE